MAYLKQKPGSIEDVVAKQQTQYQDPAYQKLYDEELKNTMGGIGSMTPKEKQSFHSKIDSQYKKAEELKEVKYTIGYEIDSDDRNDKKYKGEDEMSVNASSSRDAAKKFGQEMNKLVKKAGQRSKSILKIGMTSFEDNNRDYNKSEINKLDDYANDFIYKGIYDSYLIKAEDLNEKIEYAYLRFRNKNEANRAAKTAAELAGHHTQMPGKHIEIEVSSGGAGENLTIDGGKNDVSKIVKELVRLYRPKVLEKESLDKSVKEKMGANTPSNPNRYKQYFLMN